MAENQTLLCWEIGQKIHKAKQLKQIQVTGECVHYKYEKNSKYFIYYL